MYSAQVLNIFLHPSNAGRIMKPEGIADHYNADETSNVEFSFRIEDGVITDCMFRAQANPYITAVCSVIADKVKGKKATLFMITKDDVLSEIGEDKDNDISFCLECLDLAVMDYRKKFGIEADAMEEEKIEDAKIETETEELSSKLDDLLSSIGVKIGDAEKTSVAVTLDDDDFNLFDDDDLI